MCLAIASTTSAGKSATVVALVATAADVASFVVVSLVVVARVADVAIVAADATNVIIAVVLNIVSQFRKSVVLFHLSFYRFSMVVKVPSSITDTEFFFLAGAEPSRLSPCARVDDLARISICNHNESSFHNSCKVENIFF